jgi:O-antigen/teichoic acid export membrane protein
VTWPASCDWPFGGARRRLLETAIEAVIEQSTPPTVEPRRSTGLRIFLLDNLVVAVAQVLMKLRGLLALPLIVKTLGTEGYGLWTQILSVVTFGGAVLGANLHLPLVRFVAGKTHRPAEVYATTLVWTVAIGALGALALALSPSAVAASLLGGADYGRLLKGAGLLLVFSNVRLLNLNLYRATGQFKTRSAIDFSSAMLELVGILVVLRAGLGLEMVLVFMIAWNAVVALGTTGHALYTVGLAAPRLGLATEAFKYALPLLPSGFAYWIIDRSDRFVIGHYLGPREVGIYSGAYALGALVLSFQIPFQMTLLPQVAKLWDTDRPRAKLYIEVCTKAFLALAIPSSLAMPIVAPLALRTLANSEIAFQAAWIAALVAVGVTLQGMAIMQMQILYGAHRTAVTGAAMAGAAIANIVLTFILIPTIGIHGGALATVAGYGILYASLVALARPIMRVDHQVAFIAKACVSAAMMILMLWVVQPTRLAALLAWVAPAVLVYVGCLLALGGISRDEKSALQRLLRPRGKG